MSSLSRVNTNVPGIAAAANVGRAGQNVAGSLLRLSTGQRINRGADDPAGLIASENLRAALASLDSEVNTIDRADAVANVADGALGEISDLLTDARSRAVANANTAGLSDAERQANQLEVDSALQTADRIVSTTRFNGEPLFTGDATLNAAGASLTIARPDSASIGEVSANGQTYRLSDIRSGGALNLVTGDVSTAASSLDAAISDVATQRGRLGAFQHDALASERRSRQITIENTAAANSIIRDTDFAAESAALARGQALAASTIAAASLANASPQRALRLVR